LRRISASPVLVLLLDRLFDLLVVVEAAELGARDAAIGTEKATGLAAARWLRSRDCSWTGRAQQNLAGQASV
jgi:hypothetical protein